MFINFLNRKSIKAYISFLSKNVDKIIINAFIIAVFAYVSVYSEKLFIFTRHAPVFVIKCLLF